MTDYHSARQPRGTPAVREAARAGGPSRTPAPLEKLSPGNLAMQRALTGSASIPPTMLTASGLLSAGNQAVGRLVRRPQDGGRPLDPAWRRRLESAFDADLGDVRVHQDTVADAFTATAITRDRQIHLGQAAPPPDSAAGRALLAHEVAHVVQQGGPAGVRSGTIGSAGDRFEVAAEAAAGAVLAGHPAPPRPAGAPPTVQCQRGPGPDPLRAWLDRALREGVAWSEDGLVVGGVKLKHMERGAQVAAKLAKGDIQGIVELFKPRDPKEREKLRQQTIALLQEYERLRPPEERERLRQEEREAVVAEAQRRLRLPRPGLGGPELKLPEPTLDPGALGLRFGTITPWVLDRFRHGSATLEPHHRAVLNELARQARANPNSQIDIVGHADTTGPDAFNQRLSERRADAVRAYLIGRGLEVGKIRSVTGRGEEAPLLEERTDDDRARNRRVEISYWTGVQERHPGLLRPPGTLGSTGTPGRHGGRGSHTRARLATQAGPVSQDLSRLSDAELDRDIEQVRERLTSLSSAPDSPDRIRLDQLESEHFRRTRTAEAAAQRAPLAGILTHLALLSASAGKESGGADFQTTLDAFRVDLAKQVATVPADAPLPPDLRLVMAALALWSTDPGNQWGEGSWDSRDLVMSAAEYATIPAGQNKCNAYVAEVVDRSLGFVFKVYPASGQPGRFFPFRAHDWGDATTTIPHFPVVTSPVMGDILSTGKHVGIFLGSYGGRTLYVSARDEAIGVFGTDVQHAHGIQIKFAPATPVFRRYTP
jgi:outer membrane protein OmpA-like peptidoglycan-associated protein